MITLTFTEEMKGYVSFGVEDPDEGFAKGKLAGNLFMFHLTIEVDDVDAFLLNPRHEASARGWVRCEQLGGTLAVEQGTFNLFVDSERRSMNQMLYRLLFQDASGQPLTMIGVKFVEDQPDLDAWSDTTTLHVKIVSGHLAESDEARVSIVASGKLRIYLADFARKLASFRTRGGSFLQRKAALAAFGDFFMGQLWDVYAPKARRENREIRVERIINAPPERVWEVLLDVESWPEWNPTLLKAEPLVVGATTVMPLRVGPFVMSTRQQILEIDPPRQLRWMSRQVPGLFEVHRTFRLEPLEGGRTHLAQFERGNTPLARTILPFLERPIEEGYENLSAALAARVEGASGRG